LPIFGTFSLTTTVLNKLRNRSLGDVLIFSVDNLEDISKAIEAVCTQAEVQK